MPYSNFIEKYTKKNIINSKGICGKSKANSSQKKLIQEATDELIKLTSFAPKDYSLTERMQLVRAGITEDNFSCPVCHKPRKKSDGMSRFNLTCGSKDQDHLEWLSENSHNNLKKYIKCPVCDKEHNNNKLKTKVCSTTDNLHAKYIIKKQQEKTRATIKEKYGVSNISEIHEVKLKKISTCLEKYGVSNPSYIHFNVDNFNSLTAEFIQKEFIDENKHFNYKKFMKYINCSEPAAWRLMKEFDIDYRKKIGASNPEEEIISFIKELDPNTEIVKNTRDVIKPLELDIYLPEYNLAIEYNGLMFHSQGISNYSMFNTPDKDRNLHLKKTEACEAKGIQLLHIFENEWLDLNIRNIWQSVIRNKMHKNKYKIGARKCDFAPKKLLAKESNQFLEENHLQGAGAIGGIRYGLIYKGELVALMTFSKARFSEADYELIRFAVKSNYSIPGAASKLLKAFKKDHDGTIVSYANRRWSDGGLYEKLGFTHKNTAAPNYYYFHPKDKMKLWHRASFQKHKLKDKLDIFGESLSEQENMFLNGYRRIFDSGNYVFILPKKEIE